LPQLCFGFTESEIGHAGKIEVSWYSLPF